MHEVVQNILVSFITLERAMLCADVDAVHVDERTLEVLIGDLDSLEMMMDG